MYPSGLIEVFQITMRLSVGQKIFGITLFLLVTMISAAGVAINLTANISDELKIVSRKHLPLGNAVSRINVRILQQGIILQRVMAQTEDGLLKARIPAERNRIKKLATEIEKDFSRVKEFLDSMEASGRLLAMDIDAISNAYRAFLGYTQTLLRARETADDEKLAVLIPLFDHHQNNIVQAISGLRRTVEHVTDLSVARADSNEQRLLMLNIVLTSLAAIVGLGFAALVTRALVRSVKNLVDGTEAIKAGHLDTSVPVTSKDEVGQLTGSFNHMVGELRLKERIKDTFGRYMDPRIVSRLLDEPGISEPGGERREMTVMFIDLKGFTSISELLEPDTLVHMVNSFFSLMGKAISDNDGVVDKYMGDAVMAYWGPPFTGTDKHAALACKAAGQALEQLDIFRENVRDTLGAKAEGLDLDLRIGISTGEMIVGTIGSEVSRSFTVMGDPVNLGSRLEGASKAYGTHVLLSQRTRELAGPAVQSREIDIIRVKGKEEPIRIHELLVADNGEREELTVLFEKGLSAYRKRDWNGSEKLFKACLKVLADDPPTQVYLERIAHFKKQPPPPDWDGVWRFETK